MSSILKNLSVVAGVALALAACTSSTASPDGGTTTTTDAGKDGTASNNDSGSTGNDSGTTNNDASTGDDGSTTCSIGATGTNDATCDGCLQTNCCDSWIACFGDTDCAALQDCINACGADGGVPDAGGCQNDCNTAHSASVQKLIDAQTCALDKCDSADGGSTACQSVFGP